MSEEHLDDQLEPNEPIELEADEPVEDDVIDLDDGDEEEIEPEAPPPARSRPAPQLQAQQRAYQQQLAAQQFRQEADRRMQLALQEHERVSSLPYDEQQRYFSEVAQRQLAQQLLAQRDQEDRVAFAKLAKLENISQRRREQVERVLAEARQVGQNHPRELIWKTLVGHDAVTRRSRQPQPDSYRPAPRSRARTAQDIADDRLLSRLTLRDLG